MKWKATGKELLATAALLAVLMDPVEAFCRGTYPSVQVTVAVDAQTDKLVCTVRPIILPTSAGAIFVWVVLPPYSALTSVVLKTPTGSVALDVPAPHIPPFGYFIAVDRKRANCPNSGTLVLAIDGEFEAVTTVCPEVVMFKPGACGEAPTENR